MGSCHLLCVWELKLQRKLKLWGLLPGLIQGYITFSVSPQESQNNFVFSLLSRHESGLLCSKSGRNLLLLTQSRDKMYVRYLMSQGLKSGATFPSISVIKTCLFYLPSHFWLSWLLFEACVQNQKGLKLIGDERWDEVKSEILMKIVNISKFVIKHQERAMHWGYGSLEHLSHFRAASQHCWWKPNWTQYYHYVSGSTPWPCPSFSERTRLIVLGLGEELPSDVGNWKAIIEELWIFLSIAKTLSGYSLVKTWRTNEVS